MCWRCWSCSQKRLSFCLKVLPIERSNVECGGRCEGPSPFRKPEPAGVGGCHPRAAGKAQTPERKSLCVALIVIEQEVAGRCVFKQAAGDCPMPCPIWLEYATRHCATLKSFGERSGSFGAASMIASGSVSGMKTPESPIKSWSRKLRALVWKLSRTRLHPRRVECLRPISCWISRSPLQAALNPKP